MRNASPRKRSALDAARAERAKKLADAEAAFRAEVDRLIEGVCIRVGFDPREGQL